ncbi:MAG: hypothetical protein ACP5RH_19160, partial [Leptodesmis sp.]|uniref:hypothetical protein n=1 Tax=Leptodesmis sp. TaxID=3100501 RepID=UPI003D0FB621
MVSIHEKYEVQNLLQEVSEHDPVTLERYQQFSKLLPKAARTVLDVGCNTGRGGSHLKATWPAIEIFGLVQQGGSLHTIPIRPHSPAPSPKQEEGEPDQSPSTHLGEGFRVR